MGVFSHLKSLFVERPPLYVPDIEMHFFEASSDYLKLPPNQRPGYMLCNRTPFPGKPHAASGVT